ncbi:hypothetical protein C8Q75DRAFT_256575 [Abortiporus biennis]|nr:hypothetical protein C8Q75DRAFT_256575 [Abortiporus biennis]
MLHLQSELSKRRDKRLALASRRREYEVANITKRRKLDEDAIWSWWKNARDTLQVDMTSEASRKRRKLDRERRSLDRPQPTRHIPGPPMELPPAPTLHDLVKSMPFASSQEKSKHRTKKSSVDPSTLMYPQLTELSAVDIVGDIEFLFQHRRSAAGFDSSRGVIMGPNPYGPPGVPPGMDPYGMMAPMMEPQGLYNRFGPPPPPFNPTHMQGPVPIGFPGPSNARIPNMSLLPSSMGPPPQMMIDSEAGIIRRPASVSGQPSHMHQQYPSHAPSPVPVNFLRRSPSPPPMPPIPSGHRSGPPLPPPSSKSQNWMGDGGSGQSPMPGPAKESKRVVAGDVHSLEREAKEHALDNKNRDKERELEHDREMERQYHLSQHPQQRLHSHQHVHPPGSGAPHHHHHHHHHVHHHHHPNHGIPGPQPSSLSNGAGVSVNGTTSPRNTRELDNRRTQPGTPMEIIELPTSNSKSAPSPASPFWKGNEQRAAGASPDRPLSALITPVQAMQAMQSGFPTSPRVLPPPPGPGPSTSRRGSWSEENGPRPSSSSNMGPSTNGPLPSHRLTPSVAGQGQGSRTLPSPSHPSRKSSVLHSPPRSNGLRLPPVSPQAAANSSNFSARSPVRLGQGPPLPSSSTLPSTSGPSSSSPPKLTSPKVHRQTPPPPMTRSPLIRESSNNHNPATSIMNSLAFPPPSSSSTLNAPSSRLVGGVLNDRHSPNLPNATKINAVPIDGS